MSVASTSAASKLIESKDVQVFKTCQQCVASSPCNNTIVATRTARACIQQSGQQIDTVNPSACVIEQRISMFQSGDVPGPADALVAGHQNCEAMLVAIGFTQLPSGDLVGCVECSCLTCVCNVYAWNKSSARKMQEAIAGTGHGNALQTQLQPNLPWAGP